VVAETAITDVLLATVVPVKVTEVAVVVPVKVTEAVSVTAVPEPVAGAESVMVPLPMAAMVVPA
jgi:hypothetical protein